ncbi:hypothetical protein BU16DRAFT_68589 [Lophium mytilinum]|uniref:Uncharacterized protein n=1 Tax=Lophium mytilinum TaxID=390894 RepID=A0A6A6QPZ7_9PEZI|nr:hypothetical protein BU16DRAFT_68589 [Lophium mytilinum]
MSCIIRVISYLQPLLHMIPSSSSSYTSKTFHTQVHHETDPNSIQPNHSRQQQQTPSLQDFSHHLQTRQHLSLPNPSPFRSTHLHPQPPAPSTLSTRTPRIRPIRRCKAAHRRTHRHDLPLACPAAQQDIGIIPAAPFPVFAALRQRARVGGVREGEGC